MREERPCHNVRIVTSGQVTSEPQNKSVLNLMKWAPGAGEIPEHGLCVLGEAASWGLWFGRLANAKCL